MAAGSGRERGSLSRELSKKAMYEKLMEQVVTRENATEAWLAVKRNGGAAGIDRMSTGELREHIRANWDKIQTKLLAGTYVPSPVRPVEIPKPNGGTRQMGIPTVQDRWIQQMLLQVLQPIFDPIFSEHSYGFRPNRGAQDAVGAAQKHVKFLGFRINRQDQIEAAPQSVERLKDKVREMWRSCQSLSSAKLRDGWRAYIRGWWAYYGLAEDRRNIFAIEGSFAVGT